MNTPIFDFVRNYAEKEVLRLHMPGHKGKSVLGMEHLDITEIDGADSLYEADGIIRESERNASELFGCETYYSTEGSSQCIRAMLHLAAMHARRNGKAPVIAAGRNAHKTFLSAAALLDLDVIWMYPKEQTSYLSCAVAAEDVEKLLADVNITAVYLTSPDYLGNIADIKRIAEVCRKKGVLLLVDNAHGAYLRFLSESRHPIDLGADLCCDSAHKTLPVLTGGAYLHLSGSFPEDLRTQAKNALVLFGSTSPSYLILQSLDAANAYLADGYREKLAEFAELTAELKQRLAEYGYSLFGDEPLKLTIAAKEYGYCGTDLARILERQGIICEFADPDFLVLMLTPEVTKAGLFRLEQALCKIERKAAIGEKPPVFNIPERVMRIREAMLSVGEVVSVEESAGRVLSAASVGCPPAVPIVVSGERIDKDAIKCFRYYGIENCTVVE